MGDLLLGIDVGTYSSKGTLVTLEGRVVRSAVVPHGIATPAPGLVEQDADAVWWHDVRALCAQLLDGRPHCGSDVAAVAVSAIGPCLLPLDAGGRPLRPGILYGVDVRAAAEIDEIEARVGRDAIFAHSLMNLTSQAIGPKIAWLRKHEPEVWRRTTMLTTASSYLVWKLTGAHRIDRHQASQFMPMFDPRRGGWSGRHDEIAPTAMLPQPGWCDELAGTVTAEAAAATGLAAGTPVAIGAVDALSEAVSVGVVRPGDLMIMYGSTTFFILVQERPTPDERVWTVAGAYPDQFNLAAGMSTTGSLTRWFKDELARDLDPAHGYAELFGAAARVAPGAGGLLCLPYFSGERTPINDPRARGVIAGLSLAHGRDHLFRAVLEGVGFGVRHNLETLQQIGARIERLVAVGGGAQTDVWLQIVSDICGRPQEVPAITVGASYGDAFLAGCAAGHLKRDDIDRWVRSGRTVVPNAATASTYDAAYQDYLALYRQTRDVVHRLGARAG